MGYIYKYACRSPTENRFFFERGVLIFKVLRRIFAVFVAVPYIYIIVPRGTFATFLFYIIILAQGSSLRLIPPPVFLGLNTIANFAIAISISLSISYNAFVYVPQYLKLLIIKHLTFYLQKYYENLSIF